MSGELDRDRPLRDLSDELPRSVRRVLVLHQLRMAQTRAERARTTAVPVGAPPAPARVRLERLRRRADHLGAVQALRFPRS